MIAETTNLSTAGFNMLEPKEITLDTMNYPTGSHERKAVDCRPKTRVNQGSYKESVKPLLNGSQNI